MRLCNFWWEPWSVAGYVQTFRSLAIACLFWTPDRADALTHENESIVDSVLSTESQNSVAGSCDRGLVR